ncbi:hypothetical protein C9374_012498 [Naegleria lovaniensis]|uniref:Uncharacterized protein n=1 Tax=Naegleria lovaniensis TaxID=51637 RepID=A0AA88H3B8_NAELO|nr:uncharacterized protein C9374_012498 [Naegleria lovaniensis]KAG2392246.1 hypothetical protein C9374_012498 [Naegleria lovaniensis]
MPKELSSTPFSSAPTTSSVALCTSTNSSSNIKPLGAFEFRPYQLSHPTPYSKKNVSNNNNKSSDDVRNVTVVGSGMKATHSEMMMMRMHSASATVPTTHVATTMNTTPLSASPKSIDTNNAAASTVLLSKPSSPPDAAVVNSKPSSPPTNNNNSTTTESSLTNTDRVVNSPTPTTTTTTTTTTNTTGYAPSPLSTKHKQHHARILKRSCTSSPKLSNGTTSTYFASSPSASSSKYPLGFNDGVFNNLSSSLTTTFTTGLYGMQQDENRPLCNNNSLFMTMEKKPLPPTTTTDTSAAMKSPQPKLPFGTLSLMN